MGAFDAAGLAVKAVGGAEHEGVFLKPVDFPGAEIFTGVDAKISFAAIAFSRVREGNMRRLVLTVGGA